MKQVCRYMPIESAETSVSDADWVKIDEHYSISSSMGHLYMM